VLAVFAPKKLVIGYQSVKQNPPGNSNPLTLNPKQIQHQCREEVFSHSTSGLSRQNRILSSVLLKSRRHTGRIEGYPRSANSLKLVDSLKLF